MGTTTDPAKVREYQTRYRARQMLKVKVTPLEKACHICKAVKPAVEFYKMSTSNDGLQSYCIDCNKDRRRGAHIASHGITVERYEEMMLSQGGQCAICREAPRRQGRITWVIDHDHKCCPGEKSCGLCVRGLLCNSCNRAIGLLRDDPDVLMSAAAYLLTQEG